MKRRDFLRFGTASAAAMPFMKFVHGAETRKPRRVGLIGSGWYGKVDLLRLIQVEPVEVVSLCDVDSNMLASAADIVAGRQKSGKKPNTFSDYRKMLASEEHDIVLVGTPDHWHALAMIAAVEAGANVYVQKPISVDIVEGQAMLDAARRTGKVVQVGTQRRSTPHLIEAKQRVVDEGLLGNIAHAEVYCYYHMRARGLHPEIPVPENLDYEMWAGPAPKIPYNDIIHPRRWRAFREYSNGIMGDMCIHMLDMVRWMLGLGWPKSVASTGGILVDKNSTANIPDTQNATFDFGDMDIIWQHRTWGDAPDRDYPWGATIYGDRGTLKLSVNKYEFFPSGKTEPTLSGTPLFEYDKYPEDETEKDLERHVASAVRWHMKDLLDKIDNGGRPVADIEEGYISTASCILANMALDLGRTLHWDPTAGKVIDDDQANALLARPYRGDWIHPEPKKA